MAETTFPTRRVETDEAAIHELPDCDLIHRACDAAAAISNAIASAWTLVDIALEKLPNSTDDIEAQAILDALKARLWRDDSLALQLTYFVDALAARMRPAEVSHG